MLQSEMTIDRMCKENHRHYQRVREINSAIAELTDELEKENYFHKKKTEEYKKDYDSSVKIEKELLKNLRNKFDGTIPYAMMFEYFTEREILNVLSKQEFQFLRDMKAFTICGCAENCIIYTPNWKRKES